MMHFHLFRTVLLTSSRVMLPDSECFWEFIIVRDTNSKMSTFSLTIFGTSGGKIMTTGHFWNVGERKWVEWNGSNRPPVPWVESSPFRNWVEWTWVDLEKCQVQGRQHIDFDPSPFDPIRSQSIRPKLFDQKGRPNSFRPISFDPFHAIPEMLHQNPTNL